MEIVAERITTKCNSAHRERLSNLMEEKVDMMDDGARATWVEKKKALLTEVMGGMVVCLEEMGSEEVWKERAVREMSESWERRWKTYGAMSKEDLQAAEWILKVGQ